MRRNVEQVIKEFVGEETSSEIDVTPETERNKKEIQKDNILSSGSALLNLACTH